MLWMISTCLLIAKTFFAPCLRKLVKRPGWAFDEKVAYFKRLATKAKYYDAVNFEQNGS